MTTICIANQKGGVGKSTTAFALGTGLIRKGYTVLFLDLDPQGNLSYTMRSDPEQFTMFDVIIKKEASMHDAIQKTPTGDIVPSSKLLASADMQLTLPGREYYIRNLLNGLITPYDYVIIDTPPALGILTVNALTASKYLIIPSQADIYSLQGIGQLYESIDAIQTYCNPELIILGILLTRYDRRTNLSRDMTEMIEETASQLHTRVFNSYIRETVIIKEAQAKRSNIYDYAVTSNAAIDCLAFTDEFLNLVKEAQHA